MKPKTFSAALLGTTAIICLGLAAPAAFADGMPYGATKPQPSMTPLDQALDQIQEQAPPVAVTPPPAEEAPEPEVVQPALPTPPAVPESRVVDVQPNTSFFGLSVGMYDPFTNGEQAPAFNFEWQPGVKIAGVLQPLFGAFATTEGSMMGYGGIGVPFNVTDNVFIMPSVAVGAYRDGDGVDLDSTLAFRFGTEVAYQFQDKSRLGINAHMISNGESFDHEDRTEVISLVYTMPTTLLSGKPSSPLNAAAPTMNTTALDAAAVQPAAGGSDGSVLLMPQGINN